MLQEKLTVIYIELAAAALGILAGCATPPPRDTRIRCWRVPVWVTSYGADSGFTTPRARWCESDRSLQRDSP